VPMAAAAISRDFIRSLLTPRKVAPRKPIKCTHGALFHASCWLVWRPLVQHTTFLLVTNWSHSDVTAQQAL
jgi:hypothetical protein